MQSGSNCRRIAQYTDKFDRSPDLGDDFTRINEFRVAWIVTYKDIDLPAEACFPLMRPGMGSANEFHDLATRKGP
jgi:hypothetical protein